MSRIAKVPVFIPDDVDVTINGQIITIKGNKGELTRVINNAVEVIYKNNTLSLNLRNGYVDAQAQAGTARATLNLMVIGVTEGFIKKLQLVGVGYRALIEGDTIHLSLGFSHPIKQKLPFGIIAECPTQTEIVLKSPDKQLVGQIAANLVSYRRSDPYKGKGVRYADQVINIKETKKK